MKIARHIFACLFLVGTSGSALASETITLNCYNSGIKAAVLVFDVANDVAQTLRYDEKPIFFADHGRIVPSKVTDDAFSLKHLTYGHVPTWTLSISRENGAVTFEATTGQKFPWPHFECKPSSENISFIAPLLSADIHGNIDVSCRDFRREPRVGELYPVNDKVRIFGLNIVSKEVVDRDPTSGTRQFGTIGGAGTDSIQICESGDCRRTWVLNLITGGLFPMTEFGADFQFDGKTQFVCTPKPR